MNGKRSIISHMLRKTITTIFFLLPVCLSGQIPDISLYRVSLDSLVSMMQRRVPDKHYYFVEDSDANIKFTFNCSEGEFVNKAIGEMRSKGYSLSYFEDDVFILRKVGLSTSLPKNYFTEGNIEGQKGDNAFAEVLDEDAMVASFANKTYEIGRNDNIQSDQIFLGGTVKNVRTGEPIVGVSVYNEKAKTYATTNEFGYYKLPSPAGQNIVSLSGFSLEEISLNVEIYQSGTLDIVMKEKVYSLKEATVSAESVNNRRSNKIGVELVRIGRIKQVPTVFGEADVLKVILTLPGVKSVGEASGGFNVRGGSTDQNLILYNDGTVYNPTHLFGIFSAFNPDVVNDLELYKSSIPASYGGRISSVLDVHGREGNNKKITGSAGIGLLTARAHLEGPISNSTSFILGGRTTYSDWILKLLPENSGYNNGSAFFYDANASITQKLGKRNTLYAYGYYSRDGFAFSKDTTYRYSNLNASLKWRSIINDEHSLVLSAGYDQYKYNNFDKSNSASAYNLGFGISQGFIKLKFNSILSDAHKLEYGVHGIYYNVNPGSYLPYGDSSQVFPNYLDKETALEMSAFISDTWTFNDKLSADLGIRYSNFVALNPTKYYGGPEFRISGKYLINDYFTLKAGFNSMRQYIHMLSNTAAMSPTDTWKLSDENIKPQSGWQGAVAVYSNIFDNKVELSLEGYYKQMKNYLDYKSGAVLTMNENLAEDVISTRGRAWGAEFMAKKSLGKLNGWISYTYSRTQLKEMEGRGINTINNGDWYPAPYDKPHDLKFVGNYKFTHRFSLSMNVEYSTGRPITIPVSKYYLEGGWRLQYSDRNSYRVPDYFRMDAAINIEPSHYLKKLTYFSITVGVYNVTGRKNAYSIYYNTSEGNMISCSMLTIFGAPIPYININMKF